MRALAGLGAKQTMAVLWAAAIALFALADSTPAPASASAASAVPRDVSLAGTLDRTLRATGFSTVSWGDWAGAVGSAVQRDGSIVTVGEARNGSRNVLLSTRMTPAGKLDPSYGRGGLVTLSPNGEDTGGNAIALLPKGKILLAGATKVNHTFAFMVVRLLRDGSIDRSFGNRGFATVPIGNSAIANALAVQRDGKIVLAGTALMAHNEFAAARLNPDGTIDRSFGYRGITTLAPEGGAWWMTLQPDGGILLAGQTAKPPNADLVNSLLNVVHDGQEFMAARLLQNGRLDPSFGRRGIVTVAIGDTALGFSVAVQPDGRIILAGNAYAPRLVAATVRLLPNGVLDPTYGRRGIAKLPVALGINAMTLQPDGDILLGGVGASAIRLLPNGSPDPTFGRAGIATVALGDTGGAANGITLAPGRKIVLAGAAQFLGRITLTVIRLNG